MTYNYSPTLVGRLLVGILGLAAASDALAQATQFETPGSVRRALSLDEAIQGALAGNSDLAVAEAQDRIAGSQSRAASAPLWPRIDVDAGYLLSVDPVVAFGTKLRQGRFGPDDLDFEELNNPDAIDDWSTGIGVRWSILDPTVWASRSSASHRAVAASWSTERTREATVLITRSLYYRALAAEARMAAALAAEEAARATLDLFRKRRERGLLTEADLLQSEAELAATEARLSEANRVRLDAAQDLGLHLGWGPDSLPQPTDTLAVPADLSEEEFEPEARADLRALAAAADAADAVKIGASLTYIPALDVFGRYSTHATDPLSFDASNWTVGVALRWTLFSGFARSADSQQAEMERRIARIQYEEALRKALSQVEQAERGVRSAREQVAATRAASDAATSGRDLMRRRFEEGLAIAADLLQAEARATEMRERAINALASYHIAIARLEFARSQSNTENPR